MPRSFASALLAGLAALAVAAPASAWDHEPGTSTARYVDCSAPDGGDGSARRPWNDLDRPSADPLRPGARVLLRRGTTCRGTLALGGSGSRPRPALVGAYGVGPRPRIVADGGVDAVALRDASWVTVQDLDLSNPGPEARRRGVHVVAATRLVRGVTLRRLHVHDVTGDLAKDADGSGGIQADVLGPLPARFDRLRIVDNRIEDVSRSGIFIVGTSDPDRPRASEPWPAASTGVLVRGNVLTRLGGDGIVPLGTVGARVIANDVSEGNLRGRSLGDPRGYVCNAGIWTFHANGTRIARNEVHHMRFNGCDGTGFDVDYDQDATVVEQNYSHDNEGGFVLLCTDTEPRAAEVRFNLSLDDRFALNQSPCSRPGGTFDGIRVYGNTVVAADPAAAILGIRIGVLLSPLLEFRDNIVAATTPQPQALPCGLRCSHNLFSGLPPAGEAAVAGDPRFVDPTRRGTGRLRVGRGFRLAPGSPARRAGVAIPAGGRRDYFGVRVPTARPPDIGFSQAP